MQIRVELLEALSVFYELFAERQDSIVRQNGLLLDCLY